LKVEIKSRWIYNPSNGALEFYAYQWIDEQDLYDATKQPKPNIVIHRAAYLDLLDWIKENERDIVKTDRSEDLKIIHRLLDILEKGGSKS
jgi:hypothetical protein